MKASEIQKKDKITPRFFFEALRMLGLGAKSYVALVQHRKLSRAGL